MSWEKMKSYTENGIEYQPYYSTETGVIMQTETITDAEILRRRLIVADHCKPDHPVFNPEDYT
jgi:hypothetical protein